jgi:hypothetical protein
MQEYVTGMPRYPPIFCHASVLHLGQGAME